VSINAGTKYIAGHSDAMVGLIACDRGSYRRVKKQVAALGAPASPDDCYLALRGLRTLAVRLDAHERGARRVAEWLEGRPEVARVLHPALPSHPQHALFVRDFSGACGLFSFQLTDDFSAVPSPEPRAPRPAPRVNCARRARPQAIKCALSTAPSGARRAAAGGRDGRSREGGGGRLHGQPAALCDWVLVGRIRVARHPVRRAALRRAVGGRARARRDAPPAHRARKRRRPHP
jgi:hypothetical protein